MPGTWRRIPAPRHRRGATLPGMKAVSIVRPGERPVVGEIDRREPGAGEVLIEVEACGVCRTDLHIADGEIPTPKLPVVPGHEIVGRVAGRGDGAARFAVGDRVGVPWLAWTCGECEQCLPAARTSARERFHRQGRDGGYAELTTADERYCLPVPDGLGAAAGGAAALRRVDRLPLAAARGRGPPGRPVRLRRRRPYRRPGGRPPGPARVRVHAAPAIPRLRTSLAQLGAEWSGARDEAPPEPLDAAIIFAPVGALVPAALGAVGPGGSVVCAGIHMSEIPAMPYELLWGERTVRSVANLTRRDGEEFMELMAREPVVTRVHTSPLEEAPAALDRLRSGQVQGAEVLLP